MSIADSQEYQHPYEEIATKRRLRDRIREFLPARWIVLLAGIGCLAYSQYMMEQRFVLGQPIPVADEWNLLYRLEIVNFTNVLAALPYFVVGVLLCAWVGLPASWKEPFVNWAAQWPAFRAVSWGKLVPRLLLATALMTFLLIRLGQHNYAPIYPFLWLAVLWLFTLVVWQLDRGNQVNLSLELTFVDVLWLLGLLLLGLGIGAYALQDIPAMMVPDEGSFWENARAIALKQYRPAFFDAGVYTFPIASSIVQSWLMRLFGINLWGWRFSSVLVGVAAVVPLYLLGKEWFGRRVAVVSCILMLANPYFLSFARLGYNNSQSLFPVVLAVYLWAMGSRKGSYLYLWLAGLIAGLGFYTYSAVWIGIVTLVLGVVYLRILRQISWKQSFLVLAMIVLAWGLAFAPRLAYTAAGKLKHGLVYKVLETSFFSAFYARAYYGEMDLTQTMPLIELDEYPTIFYDPLVYSELLTRGWVRTLLALFDPHLISEHFLITPLAGMIAPVFFAIGFFLFLRRWKQSRFGLPLIWLVSGLIFLSIIGAFPPRHTHMVSLIPVIALIAGAGLWAVIETLAESLPTRFLSFRTAITSLLIAAVSLGILYSGAKRYFVTMPQTYPPIFEDFATWVAWRTEKPVQIIYLGRTDIPHRVAYLINSNMVPHAYLNIELEAFSPRDHANPSIPTVLFWETRTAEGIESLEQVPAGFHAPVAFHSKEGEIIGYAATNSADVPLEWQPGGWSSLTDTPVWNLLLLLLVSLLVVAVLTIRNRFSWPHLSFAAGRRVQEEASDDPIEKTDALDIEVSFRIRVSPRKRNQP